VVGAIDAVCDVAQRIIGKLKEGSPTRGTPRLGLGFGGGAGDSPPTPAMKRFADSIARQKRIKPPPGYTKSGSICRAFLQQHIPKKVAGETAGEPSPKMASPAQVLSAEKIVQEKGRVIADQDRAGSSAMSESIESNQSAKPGKGRRKTNGKQPGFSAAKTAAPTKRARKPKAAAPPPTPAQLKSGTNTPLRIPYGNKEVAQKLGARCSAGGWYAPPGVWNGVEY
jgi:DNA topoisomerase-3